MLFHFIHRCTWDFYIQSNSPEYICFDYFSRSFQCNSNLLDNRQQYPNRIHLGHTNRMLRHTMVPFDNPKFHFSCTISRRANPFAFIRCHRYAFVLLIEGITFFAETSESTIFGWTESWRWTPWATISTTLISSSKRTLRLILCVEEYNGRTREEKHFCAAPDRLYCTSLFDCIESPFYTTSQGFNLQSGQLLGDWIAIVDKILLVGQWMKLHSILHAKYE